MAPDLNSVPASPRQQRPRPLQPSTGSTMGSRRTSVASPSMPQSPVFVHSEQSGMPLRHPRPMTAAEIHLELEKEQEAVVNRLTRELSALRAQHSASVASNHSVSSTVSTTPSLLPFDSVDPNPTHQMIVPTHPTPSRRHRSSSSISRGNPTPVSTSSAFALPQSQASADRTAAATSTRPSSSRNHSISATASGTSTPAIFGLRPSPSQTPASLTSSQTTVSTHATAGSPSQPVFSPAETARARSELESVKAENEALKDKIRALERTLRGSQQQHRADARAHFRRGSSASDVSARVAAVGVNVGAWAAGTSGVAGPRERSESQSTEASVRRGLAVQGEDEVVKVGESAAGGR